MPIWSEIGSEIQTAGIPAGFDHVRRRYLAKLAGHTGRETVLYAAKFTQPTPSDLHPDLYSISDGDMQGLMETLHGLHCDELDLILHSPGGGLDAAESLVAYLRTKISHLRVIVPHLAMSAATMMACAANCIVMGKHSFLGPIDPQFVLTTPLGMRMVPAQAILEQFDLAMEECKDPNRLAAWYPMLSMLGPDMLIQCRNASRKSRRLAREWLRDYMFAGQEDRVKRSERIARWLSDHSRFGSHGRHIPREELVRRGLVIERLEDDQVLQDLVLSVFHATTHTFAGTDATKIIENHVGRALILRVRSVIVSQSPSAPAQAPTSP